MPEGVLEELTWQQAPALEGDATATASLQIASQNLHLNAFLGNGLRIEFNGRITCCGCGANTRRSYADGYCWSCFRALARCDLCVLSPARCHYHLGTCREPAWGEAFCMQPHVVYLANSSAPKVGLTRAGRQVRRWLDQGARQGLVIAEAPTRHLAGVLEERLSGHVSDRTDWRALVARDAPPADLEALARALPQSVLPEGALWRPEEPVVTLAYPLLAYPAVPQRLELATAGACVAGRFIGAKGQYLLFDHGVFNVRRHRGHQVRVSVEAADVAQSPGAPHQAQLELFSS